MPSKIEIFDFHGNEFHYGVFLAKDNLAKTKEKYEKTIGEKVQLTFRWGIDDATENQRVVTARIWNEPDKVGFVRIQLEFLNISCHLDKTKPRLLD